VENTSFLTPIIITALLSLSLSLPIYVSLSLSLSLSLRSAAAREPSELVFTSHKQTRPTRPLEQKTGENFLTKTARNQNSPSAATKKNKDTGSMFHFIATQSTTTTIAQTTAKL
jgi:hypothetical protein